MADFDLKTATPDTSLPTTGFLFGADSQASASPSVYSTQTVATTLLGSTSLTGATITTSQPVLDLAQTWNASGVTFTGLKFNATDTASAAASLLMDLQVGGTSRFRVTKTNIAIPSVANSTQASISSISSTNSGFYTADGVEWGYTRAGAAMWQCGFEYFRLSTNSNFGWGTSVTSANDTILTRRAAANLRLGAADTSSFSTVTLTLATPGNVNWGSHGLTTGTPVLFSTTGALPTGLVSGATYYAIIVDANNIRVASSFANALAGTAIAFSGSQSGTQYGTRGAIAQTFGVQDVLSTSSLENIDGADFIIRGSRSIGNKPGGSIVFQVAPAGSTGTAQNALATALTINGAGTITASLPATNNVFDVTFAGTRALRVNNTALALAAGITFDNDNSYDIGASGGNRPRNVFVAGYIRAAGANGFWAGSTSFIFWDARTQMSAPASNVLRVDDPSSNAAIIQTRQFTVANLPSAASYPGSMAFVSDATATTARSTVAGGGSNKVMVMSDGTNWLIVA